MKLRSTPPPTPPVGWVQRVLADLVAVDVERWRRFDGVLRRSDEMDGETWSLKLAHGDALVWEPGSSAAWWRHGLSTVPELVGTLTAGERSVPATVELVRTRRWVTAQLTLRGDGPRHPEELHTVIAPLPPPEGVAGAAAVDAATDVSTTTAWSGFPGPLTDVWPQVPLDTVVGASVWLGDLIELADEPHELLLSAAAAVGDPSPALLLRLDHSARRTSTFVTHADLKGASTRPGTGEWPSTARRD